MQTFLQYGVRRNVIGVPALLEVLNSADMFRRVSCDEAHENFGNMQMLGIIVQDLQGESGAELRICLLHQVRVLLYR